MDEIEKLKEYLQKEIDDAFATIVSIDPRWAEPVKPMTEETAQELIKVMKALKETL